MVRGARCSPAWQALGGRLRQGPWSQAAPDPPGRSPLWQDRPRPQRSGAQLALGAVGQMCSVTHSDLIPWPPSSLEPFPGLRAAGAPSG